MRDDEDDLPQIEVKTKKIVYGSLEAQAEEIAANQACTLQQKQAPASTGPREMSAATRAMVEERQAAENVIAEKRLQREVEGSLPVLDPDVRLRLRTVGEPITLFGEGPYERRQRLREILARLSTGQKLDLIKVARDDEPVEPRQTETFYTEGAPELLAARLAITTASLTAAKRRIAAQQAAAAAHAALPEAEVASAQAARQEKLRRFYNVASAVAGPGDVRPLSCARVSPDGEHALVSSWNRSVYLYTLADLRRANELGSSERQGVYAGHTDRVTGCAFHPQSTVSQDNAALNFATVSSDKSARLWSFSETAPLATLEGHTDKVNKTAFHPSGGYLGTTSDDRTFRLWDVNAGREACCVSEQEGHAASVYGVAFHPDGSIVATSDVWGVGRITDLRTGRSLFVLEGHAKDVLGLSFSPNGWLLATGGSDNLIKVWDLRRRECLATIPTHSHLVSSLAFEPTNGSYLAASSYDGSVSLYDSQDFRVCCQTRRYTHPTHPHHTPCTQIVKMLRGHDSKVTCVDVSPDGNTLVSSGFDGNFKLWKQRGEDEYVSWRISPPTQPHHPFSFLPTHTHIPLHTQRRLRS